MIKKLFSPYFFLLASVLIGQELENDSATKINFIEAIQNTNQLLVEFEKCQKTFQNLPKSDRKSTLILSLDNINQTTRNFMIESKQLIDFMRKNRFKDAEIEMVRVASASILNSWNLDFEELIKKLSSNKKSLLTKKDFEYINQKIDDQDILRYFQIQLIAYITKNAKNKDIVNKFKEVN